MTANITSFTPTVRDAYRVAAEGYADLWQWLEARANPASLAQCANRPELQEDWLG